MTAAARNRCTGNSSFIVCFYCNETFRSLTSLLKHSCPAEKNISLDCESLELLSDSNDVDLTQEDWEPRESVSDTNDYDPGQEDSVSSESVSEKLSDIRRQEITQTESNDNVFENSLPGTETECEQPLLETKSNSARQEIADLTSDPPEKQLLEAKSDVAEVADLGSDESEKLSSEAKSDAVREEVTDLGSDVSEKQSSEAKSDTVKDVIDLASDASEKHSSEAKSDAVKDVIDLASDASEKQLLVADSDSELKIIEEETNADDEFYRASPDLVSKVLQYYEKDTKQGTTDSCCKSPLTEMVFQSSQSPLPTVEPSSPRHDTEMECTVTDVGNKGLPSETKGDTFGVDTIQKKSDTSNQDAGSESDSSNMCSRPPSPDVDSSDIFSRSSSIEMDLDSLGCGNDKTDSNTSDLCTLSLTAKNSHVLKHDNVQVELHASKTSDKSLPEQNLNITKYGSVVLKPCYVKIQDIFKSLSNPKLSPKKIFSRKKKYHVCDVCYKFFRLRSDLNIHYLIHSCDKPYVCNICDKSFFKQCTLLAHHLAHTIKRHHVCSLCKKRFPKESLLLRHKLTHTKEKPFACDKCDKRYSVKSSLTEHYASHLDERPYVCEICNASFYYKRYLRKHYYRHQRKDSVCEFCFRTFKHKHNLDQHYNVHVNDRPHECKICGKSFHLLLTLNKHYAVSHRNKSDLMFKKSGKTLVDHKKTKDPVIQKIEKSAIIDEGEKTPVQKIKESTIDYKSKETVPYSTRRKSFTPRRYLQPDSFVFY